MVGAQPSMEIIAKEDRITILNHEKGTREEKISDDPMNEPSEIASQWEPVKIDGLPDVFCGMVQPSVIMKSSIMLCPLLRMFNAFNHPRK